MLLKSKTKLGNHAIVIVALYAYCLVVEKRTSVMTIIEKRQLYLCPHIMP